MPTMTRQRMSGKDLLGMYEFARADPYGERLCAKGTEAENLEERQ
jgi:hypothetical protein